MDTLSKLIYIEINHPPRSSLVAVRVRLSGDDSLIYRSPVATINNRRPRLEPSLRLASRRLGRGTSSAFSAARRGG